jgi:hypothetical protein
MLRQGIEKARAGSKAEARALFEEIVEKDAQNEKAWFWLASVLDDDEEKRQALAAVLRLNPNNDRARKALDLIEARTADLPKGDEVLPGVSRRTLTLALGIGGAIIILLIALLLVVSINTNRAEQEQLATQTAFVVNTQNTEAAITQAAIAYAQTQAAITPTAVDLQQVAPTLPPEWTATPVPTAMPTREPLAFPQGLQGRLAAWGGRDVEQDGFWSVGYISATDGSYTSVGEHEGIDTVITSNGGRIYYTRFIPSLFATLVQAINVNGTDAGAVEDIYRPWLTLFDPKSPGLSADDSRLVFAGRDASSQVDQIYVVQLGGFSAGSGVPTLDPTVAAAGVPVTPSAPSPITRITNDLANYSEPDLSPDGSAIVAVRDDVNSADAGADLYVIQTATGVLQPLTNDRGNFVERSPSWSPDTTVIVYAITARDQPNNGEIVVRFSNGSGQQTIIASDPVANDITPVFSPDGRHIAFSSNRGGNYDIYIWDVVAETLTQLTNTPDIQEFIGAWR